VHDQATQTSTGSRTPSRLRARDPNRLSLILVAGTLFACVAWAFGSRYIAPELIRSVYYRTGWSVLNRMIVGQASHPLSSYLATWNAFAWRVLLILPLPGLFVLLVARPEFQNAFWGPEPVVCAPGFGAKATAQRVTADPAKLSWRERLARFAHSRETALLFGMILPVALLLRLLFLGAKSLDHDEIFSVLFARLHLPGFWSVVTQREANMVLYYAILRFWIHLGQTAFVIRSLSVILGLATVLAVYWLGTRALGAGVGSLGALLLAFNGFHIEYSQDARSYSLLVFLVTLSSLFFLESFREGSRRNWIRYIISSTLAIYAHIFAVLVLVAHWVFLLLLPRRRAPWRRMVPSTVAIAFLALPMELFVLMRNDGQLSWVPRTTVRGVCKLFLCFAGKPDRFSPLGYASALLLLVYSIPVVISILALARSRHWSMENNETLQVGFLVTWLSVPILLVLAISIVQPAFWDRFLIICLPPFILLASYGFSRLRRAWLVVALLCVVAGLTARGLFTYDESPGEDWRAAAQYILSNRKRGDVLVSPSVDFRSCLEYYLQKEQAKPAWSSDPSLALLAPSPGGSFGPILRGRSSQYDRVWFIGYTVQGKAAQAFELKERSIQASLVGEFSGTQQERPFSGGLVVSLYHK
jgi:mannosyltransferase